MRLLTLAPMACLIACALALGIAGSAAAAPTCVPKANAKCKGVDLSGRNLAGKNLRGADFRGANLSRANLSRANLIGARMTRARLSGANLTKAKMCSADLRRSGLQRARIAPTRCKERRSGTKTRGSRAMQAAPVLRGGEPGCGESTAYRFACVGGDFRGARMAGAILSGAGVVYADFSGADLSGAQITNSILMDSNFAGANLTGVRIDGGAMVSTNLTGATLAGAVLSGTVLEAVNASGARLTGVTMPGTTGALLGDPADAPPGWGRVPASPMNGAAARGGLLAPKTRVCPTIFRFAGYGATVDLSGVDLNGISFRHPAETRAAGEATINIQSCEPTSGGVSSPTDISGVTLLFDRADLTSADLSGLRRVGYEGRLSLVDATLRGTNLSDSDLWSTDFSRANMTDANLSSARLGNDPRRPPVDCPTGVPCDTTASTNFSGARLAGSNFTSARWYGWTTCADGARRLNEAC